jgi:RNA polymerase sigma-70 factor (ECF subfamily)
MPRNSSVTDTRLIRRSQQGDRRAFRALLTRYDWRLRGLAHALLLDPEHVDAVLRVAYVKAWREVVRIDGRDDASAWLYRVVYNACIDGLRREGTRVGAPPAAADAPAGADAPGAAGAAPEVPVQALPAGGNGATPATERRRQERVVEALAALAPADRVAVVLVDREGFAPEAAARILGLTPEVVEARLAAARARLTHQLADVLAAAPAPAAEARAQDDGTRAKTAQPAEQSDEARPDEQAQPEEAKPEEAKPEEAKPEAAQSGEAQPRAAQPEAARSGEAQPEEPQPAEPPPDEQAQPEAARSGEAQPEEPQPDEPPPDEQAQPEATQPEEQAQPDEQAQPEEPQAEDAPVPVPAASDEPKAEAIAEAEGSRPAEPEDTKVASHSGAGASPNGASGTARSNGSDDTGGGAS